MDPQSRVSSTGQTASLTPTRANRSPADYLPSRSTEHSPKGGMGDFKAGSWYESQKEVRIPLRNPAKGIAATSRGVTIISSYHGAR